MNLLQCAAVLVLIASIHAAFLSNDIEGEELIAKAMGDQQREYNEVVSLEENEFKNGKQDDSLYTVSMGEPLWLSQLTLPRELIARAAKRKTLKRRIHGIKLRRKGGKKKKKKGGKEGGKKKNSRRKTNRKRKSKGKRRRKPKPIPPAVPKRHITSWINTDGSISYKLLVITDLDKKAKADANDTWKAITREGNLTLKNDLTIEIKWDDPAHDHELIGYLNYKGRAMEMSDIVEFDNRRLTVDDKTGLVYDITKGKAIPWVFLNSGPGNTTSGMKVEWLTVKDGLLYAGGHGSEFRNKSGDITSMDPMWIKTISKTGEVKSINWFSEFSRVRNAANYSAPGYLTHEAVQWSDVHRKWFFLPRKASKTAYNETEDETKGCQLLITADENFKYIVVKDIKGEENNRRGFSAFDFIPSSRDTVMVALKSEEVGNQTQTFVTVVAINGSVFLKDQPLVGDHKFEGIYFI